MSPAKVAIAGDGGWGLAVAILLDGAGHEVTVWGFETDYVEEVARTRESPKYLPGVRLSEGIGIGTDFAAQADGADLVLSVIPTQYLRATWTDLAGGLGADTPVVSLSKGIENGTLLRPTELLADILGADRRLAVLCGPSHAEEVVRGLPTTVVAGSPDRELARTVQEVCSAERFRVYTTDDVIGVELGGALKNVIALAAGMSNGLGFGDNTLAALITRGMVEIRRLGHALGARPETFSGLSGIGDLITTCVSPYGRNRAVGLRIGQGETIDDIVASMDQVAEGVRTTESVRDLARRAGVEMPIAEQVAAVLFDRKPPQQAVVDLMHRAMKAEHEQLD
jgi:glycerol-3-phosphate dehydrogenase (NAD(P)+)